MAMECTRNLSTIQSTLTTLTLVAKIGLHEVDGVYHHTSTEHIACEAGMLIFIKKFLRFKFSRVASLH